MDGYRLYLMRLGIRESTIRTRLHLFNTVKKELHSFTEKEVNRYLGGLKTKGCSNGYINLVVSLVRSICAFKELKWGKNVKYWRNTTNEKQTLSEAEITRFLSVDCYQKKEVKEKWDMFWHLVAGSGFRCGEVATLHMDEIDFAQRTVRLRETKTTPRTVPIPEAVFPMLESYCKDKQGHLFTGRNGLPTDRSGWRDDFKKRLSTLGISKQVSPHSLRHSFITSCLSEGADLYSIQRIVGHSDIRTTAVYMHPSLRSMRKAVAKNPLFISQMPAQKKLQVFKDYLREIVETLKLNEDKNISVEITEKDDEVDVKIRLTKKL